MSVNTARIIGLGMILIPALGMVIGSTVSIYGLRYALKHLWPDLAIVLYVAIALVLLTCF